MAALDCGKQSRLGEWSDTAFLSGSRGASAIVEAQAFTSGSTVVLSLSSVVQYGLDEGGQNCFCCLERSVTCHQGSVQYFPNF